MHQEPLTYKGAYSIAIKLPLDRENDSEAEQIREYVQELREATARFHSKCSSKFVVPPTVSIKWEYGEQDGDAGGGDGGAAG